jgi:hypothetical protein
MRIKRSLPFLMIALILTGCTVFGGPEPTVTPPPATLIPSATIPPILTSTPVPSPTFTPSPTPFIPFEAHVFTENTNLRTNPGYLFLVSQIISPAVTFQVLGKSPGGEWIYIQTSAGNEGWLFAQLIETDQDLQSAPVMQPEGAQLVTGKVTDPQGNPISGIQYAITQGASRTDAMTDASGIFYAFMPESSSGSWTAAYTAISCKSNTMDANCNCLGGVCGTSDPLWLAVTLPQKEPLLFTWK